MDLKPCRKCGAPGRKLSFNYTPPHEVLSTHFYVCSKTCVLYSINTPCDESWYLSAESWNDRELPFQERVDTWMRHTFEDDITDDPEERRRRFFEEACEVVQACKMSREEMHWMVDYIMDRDVGELSQEIGGVGVTLAALCNTHMEDMNYSFEKELSRAWGCSEKIREKQSNKPRYVSDSEQESPSGNITTKVAILEIDQKYFSYDHLRKLTVDQKLKTFYNL